jgi:ribulose-phosphate 3-epimerase
MAEKERRGGDAARKKTGVFSVCDKVAFFKKSCQQFFYSKIFAKQGRHFGERKAEIRPRLTADARRKPSRPFAGRRARGKCTRIVAGRRRGGRREGGSPTRPAIQAQREEDSMLNSASIFNVGFLTMREEVDQLVEGGTTMFHIDLMDGHYVPNLCLPIKLVAEFRAAYPGVILDVHLMVTNPGDYVERLAEAGADYFSFHTDATRFARRVIGEIRAAGMKPGVLINPSQRVDHIEPYAAHVDMVTRMTVEPGFAGQAFLPGGFERLAELADLRRRLGARFLINVDGGIDAEKARRCREIGVDVIVGTRHNIFQQPEGIAEACRKFNREFGG